MSVKINSYQRQLELDIPDPPLPEANQFTALETKRDKFGTFAKTLAERFPFGMRTKYVDPAMRFNWGGEVYDHRANWLAHNEKLLELFEDISRAADKEKRILNRRMQKDIELNWYFYVADLKRYLHKLRFVDAQTAHADMVQMYINRVGDRARNNQKLFMDLKVEGIEHTKQIMVDANFKIKQNPFRDAIKWPSQKTWAARISEDYNHGLEAKRQIRDERDAVIKGHADARDEAMMRQLAAHELAYTYRGRLEPGLVYINPKQAAIMKKIRYRARYGKIQPGAIGHGVRIKKNNI